MKGCSGQNPHQQKNVKFQDSHEVIDVHKLTRSEREAVWYTKQETLEMRTTTRLIICEMKKGQNEKTILDKLGHTTRGLEPTSILRKLRKNKRNQSVIVRAILEEQNEQRLYGKYDPLGLAVISRTCSDMSTKLARSRGASDAEIALTSHDSEITHIFDPPSVFEHKQEFVAGESLSCKPFIAKKIPLRMQASQYGTDSQMYLHSVRQKIHTGLAA